MVGDHARNIRAGLSGWEGQMDPLLKGFNYQVSDADSSDIADWRTAAVSGLAAARRTDKTLRSLLTASDAPMSFDEALPKPHQTFGDLERAIRDLSAALQ